MRWKHVGQEFRAHLGFTVDWDISLRALGFGAEEFVELQGFRVFGLSAMGLGPLTSVFQTSPVKRALDPVAGGRCSAAAAGNGAADREGPPSKLAS